MASKEEQEQMKKALITAIVVAVVAWIAFRLLGAVVGPSLGEGWTDVIQGAGGLVALVAGAVAFIRIRGRRLHNGS